jgi:hypothetical protein
MNVRLQNAAPSRLLPTLFTDPQAEQYLYDGVFDAAAFVAAQRQQTPLPENVPMPPPHIQSAWKGLGKFAKSFYGFELFIALFFAGWVGWAAWGVFNIISEQNALTATLVVVLSVVVLILLLFGYNAAYFQIVVERRTYDDRLAVSERVHKGVILKGVITKSELHLYHSSDRSTYSDLPPDDSFLAEVEFSYQFQTPDGRTKTDYRRHKLTKYFYGWHSPPDPAKIEAIIAKYKPRYSELEGATIYVSYLNDRNYKLL